MTRFQYAGIAVCGAFGLLSLVRLLRGATPRTPALLGAILGLLGVVAIRDPDMTTRWARAVGITRGADLLFYVVTLAFLGSCFYFYQKIEGLTRDITTLVRAIALRDVAAAVPIDTPASETADLSSSAGSRAGTPARSD